MQAASRVITWSIGTGAHDVGVRPHVPGKPDPSCAVQSRSPLPRAKRRKATALGVALRSPMTTSGPSVRSATERRESSPAPHRSAARKAGFCRRVPTSVTVSSPRSRRREWPGCPSGSGVVAAARQGVRTHTVTWAPM
ncbi:hypothetical protein DUHN55_15120 [Helicobacter pylori]